MWNEVACSAGGFRISRAREYEIRRVSAAQSAFLTSEGRLPTTHESAAQTGYSTITVEHALSAEAVSLDQPLGEATTPLIDSLTAGDDTEAQALLNCLVAELSAALRRLPERQRHILALHYGLGSFPPRSLAEIARSVQMTIRISGAMKTIDRKRVREATKTEDSETIMPLPPGLVIVFKARWKQQESDREQAGKDWRFLKNNRRMFQGTRKIKASQYDT